MSKQTSFVAEARKNILECALEIKRANAFVDALERFGWSLLNPNYQPSERSEQFQEGISKIRRALHSKLCERLSDGFMFLGVDDGLKDLSLERLGDYFTEKGGTCRRSVMQFLDRWGNLPPGWKVQDETDFRDEVRGKIKEAKTKKTRKCAQK